MSARSSVTSWGRTARAAEKGPKCMQMSALRNAFVCPVDVKAHDLVSEEHCAGQPDGAAEREWHALHAPAAAATGVTQHGEAIDDERRGALVASSGLGVGN